MGFRVGVYGWRKRCLYCFICTLTVAVILNLALTVWIVSVLDISTVRSRLSHITLIYILQSIGNNAVRICDNS